MEGTQKFNKSSAAQSFEDPRGMRSGMAVVIEKSNVKRKGVYLWKCRCDCGKEFLTELSKIRSGKVQSCGCLRNLKRIKDFTGQRFGRLTAIKRLDEKQGTSYLWLCRCDCGVEVKLPVGSLSSGKANSWVYKKTYEKRIKDIRGKRFGKLVAVSPTDKRADGGSVVWKCHCDCGNDTEVSLNRLNHGKVLSCGCLSNPPLKDYIGKRFGRLTVIKYAGKLSEKSNKHYWTCQCDCGNVTDVGQNELQSGATVSCGCYQKEKLIKSLRLIEGTSIAALEQSKKTRSNNKSGYTGVFQEKSGKWMAYINFKKKRYWLGRYDDIEDAIRARKRGEEMRDDFLGWYYSVFEKEKVKKRVYNGSEKRISGTN